MAITTSKLATLAQLRLQAERIKTELGKYALTESLGSLAYKSEVSEAELSAALKQVIDGKLDASEGMTATAIEQAIQTAISESGHAHFEKADTVPTPETAQENVLYLVLNADTGFYDIYALVSGEVVRLDDTTVTLDGYVTDEELAQAIAECITLANLSAETTGEGNAITGATYDATTGKFTFTKDATYLTADDVPVATDAEVTTMLDEVFGDAAAE